MTLIVTAYNKSAICVSTDTQLTSLKNTDKTHEAIKSTYIHCKDGKFLTTYTSNDVYIEEGAHISDWITMLFSKKDMKSTTIEELLHDLLQKLNEKYYYKNAGIPALTIIFAGWLKNQTKVQVSRITNCETRSSKPKSPTKVFDLHTSSRKHGVLVRGSIVSNQYPIFDTKVKYINKLLKTSTTSDFRNILGAQLYELNSIAHTHPKWGRYIGSITMFSAVFRDDDRLHYWRYPESKDYLLPNVNSGGISIKGIRVINDPRGDIPTMFNIKH